MKEIIELPNLLSNKSFINFIENLKKCKTVKAICIIGGVAYKGWSDNDVDLLIKTTGKIDEELTKLTDLPTIIEELKGDTTIKVLDGIPLDIWYDDMNLDRPVLVLWSR